MVSFARLNKKDKILITSALPYVNNIPHLGTLVGCTLSADVFSRYCKLRGYDSLYVCGSDEHGTATETKALEEGLSPKELCDKYFKIHTEIYEWFNIRFDVWGRTSTEEHVKQTQQIFLRLHENGYIKEEEVEQLHCPKCRKFLADRFVEGECPLCHYPDARGDQCDGCQKLLNAVDLIQPRCKICGTSPEKKVSDHLFLDLESLQNKLVHWAEEQKLKGYWTENAISTTEKWFKQGLKPRAISRDLKWGVPIPLEKYNEKVFYVWFDAPIGYISITSNARDDWKDWWQNKDVKLYQFMGKDNIPFHTIIFPATLLGTGDPWTLMHHINSTEFLNYETGKFSKSRGEGVFGDDAVNSGIPADAFRYYLMATRPENADTTFTWKDFQEKLNNELVANFANLVNRTVVFISKYFDGKVAPLKNKELEISEELKMIEGLYENVDFKRTLHEIMMLCRKGNKYFQDKAPWKSIVEDKDATAQVMANLYNFVKDISILIHPFLPATAEKVWSQLSLENLSWCELDKIFEDKTIGKPELLFQKLDDAKVKEFQEKFKGQNENVEEPGLSTEEKQDLFSSLQLKVAQIIQVREHPEADRLFILQLDLGEDKPRQIVAGLKKWYTPEELKDKKIVIITNLQPAKLRGEKSEGMLLAAGEKQVGLLTVQDASPGTLVATEDTEELAEQKSKQELDNISIEEFKRLLIDAKVRKAWFDGKQLRAGKEAVVVEKGVQGKIR